MIKIGFIVSIVLLVLKLTGTWTCSWWVIVAPIGIGIIISILLNIGIDVLFASLTGLLRHSYDKKMIKAMEEDQKDNPKYKDL